MVGLLAWFVLAAGPSLPDSCDQLIDSGRSFVFLVCLFVVRENNREAWRGFDRGQRDLERPGEGEGDLMILDGTSCGAARLAPADGSSWICDFELFLSSECHSGTWLMSSGNTTSASSARLAPPSCNEGHTGGLTLLVNRELT